MSKPLVRGRDATGELVCLAVYRHGAREVLSAEGGHGVTRELQPRADLLTAAYFAAILQRAGTTRWNTHPPDIRRPPELAWT